MIPPYERPIEAHAGLSSEEVKWSPDGRYVIGGKSRPLFSNVQAPSDLLHVQKSGSIDGSIHIWDVAPPPSEIDSDRPAPSASCTLYPIKTIETAHPRGPSRVVAFNPKSAMFASAGNELVSFSLRFVAKDCS